MQAVVSRLVAGVDEVGRGPLAGPVIAAAVIIDAQINGIKDSKTISAHRRTQLAEQIKTHALAYAYGRAEVEEIDELNIHHATLVAMQRAIEGLSIQPTEVWVDGLYVPKVTFPCHPMVKGDSLVYQISAASILAKVYRDAEMTAMDLCYPGYGFAAHKGYGTKAHQLAIQSLGLSPIHRKSFKLKDILLK